MLLGGECPSCCGNVLAEVNWSETFLVSADCPYMDGDKLPYPVAGGVYDLGECSCGALLFGEVVDNTFTGFKPEGEIVILRGDQMGVFRSPCENCPNRDKVGAEFHTHVI